MFGILRFFLASLVVLSHAGVVYGHFNPGPMAVVVFYIISGYVVSYLIDKRIHGVILKSFYAERFFRIYPQFYFHLALSVAFILGTAHISRYSEVRPDAQSIFINLTLLPLQAKAFFGYLTGLLYVPTSWSLSLEASVYVLAPFLLRSRTLDVAAWLSFGIFVLAVLGKLPMQPHTFSYATIFGTLHFFIVGTWLQRRQFQKIGLWVGLMLLAGALAAVFASWRSPHVAEVFVGGVLGIAIVAALKDVEASRLKRLDAFLGRISYPVFLNHFLIIWSFELLGWEVKAVAGQAAILGISWVFGGIAYHVVERPLDAFRRSLRGSRLPNSLPENV